METVKHPILSLFRSGICTEKEDVQDLIDVKNNIFYLFDDSTSHILVANSASLTGLFDIPERYQVFEPRHFLHGKAYALRASENNTRVAVLTEVGLYVVDLPHIRTCLLLPSCGSTPCEVWMVAPEVERMSYVFIYQVLQARWHPRRHEYLLALYNDNFLRLLDTESHTLLRALPLGRHPTSSISTLIPLRENMVDFDFAPLTKKLDEAPVYLLTGTGDVSYGVISKDEGRLSEPISLKMDNKCQTKVEPNTYACSIIVLPSTPTIIIISSTNGVISHCTLLGEGSSQCLNFFEDFKIHNERTKEGEGTYLLKKDQASIYRYYVMHESGIHAVMVPIIPIIDHLLDQQLGESHKEILQKAMRETESVVRQLVNTQVGGVYQACPLYGVGLIHLRVTLSKMLVLFADGQAIIHRIDALFPPVTDFLNRILPTFRDNRKKFSVVISNYLLSSKSSSKPLPKVGETLKNASPEETLQFLRSYYNNLKEDRLMKHTVVAELIDAKIRDNAIEYSCQQKQLQQLKNARELLQQNAERIAEQYEETNEKHVELQKRLELIGLRINAPGRSLSEEKMRTELAALKQKTDKLNFALLQSQALFENRKRQELKELKPSAMVNQGNQQKIYLSDQRRKMIKKSLGEMSDNIQEMKDMIHDLNMKLKSFNF